MTQPDAAYDSGASPPQRTLPITPVVLTVRVVVPVALFMFVMEGREASQMIGLLGSGGLLALIVIGAAIFSWLSWLRLTYYFDGDGDLRIDSGVLTRNERRVQLSRLQSVDITQPLLARIFGVAELRPEVAGSSNEGTRLRYLSLEEARRLRAELLARAAGARGQTGPAVETPERVVVRVPWQQLLASAALQPLTVGLLIAVPIVGLVAFVSGAWGLGIGGLFLFATPFFIVGGQFANHFGFTVATSPDGLRLRFGLTSHRSQTVPPGRVQAVRVERPVMWRPWGWVRVVVNVAGTTGGDDDSDRPAVVLPVAPESVARAVLDQILPGVDPLAVRLDPVPDRARWRAPLQWRNLAVGVDPRVLVTRRGWLVPKWDVVPHERTQSVRWVQGPWQRVLGLASVHIDSTPGPVRVMALHRQVGDAVRLTTEQADRARAARRAGGAAQGATAAPAWIGDRMSIDSTSHQNDPSDARSSSSPTNDASDS